MFLLINLQFNTFHLSLHPPHYFKFGLAWLIADKRLRPSTSKVGGRWLRITKYILFIPYLLLTPRNIAYISTNPGNYFTNAMIFKIFKLSSKKCYSIYKSMLNNVSHNISLFCFKEDPKLKLSQTSGLLFLCTKYSNNGSCRWLKIVLVKCLPSIYLRL